MGLVYLPTFTIKISYSCTVGKYTSPMDPGMEMSWELSFDPIAMLELMCWVGG